MKKTIIISVIAVVIIAASIMLGIKHKTNTEKPLFSEAVTEMSTEKAKAVTADTAETAKVKRSFSVYSIDIHSDKTTALDLDEEAEKTVREIFERNKPEFYSWDNINDFKINIDGVDFYYDSSGGIITKDDTHAVRLSENDRSTLNSALGGFIFVDEPTVYSYGPEYELTEAPDIEISETKVMSVFRIREINGKSITMCKMDLSGKQEIKGGLYSGGTDKAEDFKVGDIVSVVYDKMIGETFPYSIVIHDINIAVWN